MTAPVAGAVVGAGRVAVGAGRTAASAGRAGRAAKAGRSARHAAKPGRVTPKAGGARHAATGQAGRDGRQVADMGLAYGAGRGRKSKGAGSSSSSWSPTRALVAEFALCTVILALSPLAAPEGKTSPKDWMKRGSALCGVFMLLGMASSIGPKAGRASVALGGLITVVLLIDQRSMFGVISDRMKTTGTGSTPDVGPPDDSTDVLTPMFPAPIGGAVPRRRR